MDIECPYCPEPRLEADDEDGFYEYTSLLDQLVRSVVGPEVHELFQRKIRDSTLLNETDFRWCVNCSFGFYVEKNRFRFVECSNCSTLICTDCNEQWESQHEDVTCEQFRQWKVDNDLTRAKVELDRHLKRNGIDCPKCSFRFELSKGGCLHYHCTQCAHDFCGCCKAPFLKSSVSVFEKDLQE
ncbi:E3 ubiquitin-protein ligase RNF31 [Halotydeus destructor]|nr:E3 ubiquitin-protein ligase RNF31 [Halotydeus destructor]